MTEFLSKSEMMDKLESFIVEKLADNKLYEVTRVEAKDLLSSNRFDLGFKLFFLKNFKKNRCLAERIYYEDIRSQTLGSFTEYGNEAKNSFDKYVSEFISVYESIGSGGFDHGKTFVPISSSGTILNGAHRVAAALACGKTVSCLNTCMNPMVCDYQYFKDRGVPLRILDAAALQFILSSDNVYLAFIWPSTNGKLGAAEKYFPNIVFQKDIELNLNGAYNLIYQLYKHMGWVGTEKDGFAGVRVKVSECFPRNLPVKVVAFQASGLDEVRRIKAAVRENFDLEYSSIHITDTKEEADRIGNLIFNENAIHFLNYANPMRFKRSLGLIGKFKDYLLSLDVNINDVVVDGSAVLAVYGLRECSDVDYISLSPIPSGDEVFESHDEHLHYHKKRKEDLIYDPDLHFMYDGLKFVSFQQLYSMKSTRNEAKDSVDIQLMESMLSGKRFKLKFSEMRHKLVYFRIRLFKFLLSPVKWFLKQIGWFEKTRDAYHRYFK